MGVSARQYRDLLTTYLKPQGWKVLLLAMLLFASITLQLFNPFLLRRFIDLARSGALTDALTNAAFLFVVLVVANQLVSALAAYFSADVGWTATNNLRSDLALHCLRLDVRFHHEHPP